MYLTKTYDYIKERHPNLNDEQIKIILDSFFSGMKYYCSNPMESKGNVLINGLMSLYLNPNKIERYIAKVKFKQETLSEEEFKHYQSVRHHRDIQFYEDLLQLLQKHERQNKSKIFTERLAKRISEIGSSSETVEY